MPGSIGERIARYRPGPYTYPSPTGASDRWRLLPWKTRLSNGRGPRVSAEGQVLGPLAATICWRWGLDGGAEGGRGQSARGERIGVRWAGVFMVGLERGGDPRRFLDLMRERFEKFALSLHPEKTRLI